MPPNLLQLPQVTPAQQQFALPVFVGHLLFVLHLTHPAFGKLIEGVEIPQSFPERIVSVAEIGNVLLVLEDAF